MNVCRLNIENFRGIKAATVLLPKRAVLIGDNNTGKTTVFEGLDLALGPDRLNRQAPVDEHDFYQGKYRREATQAADEAASDYGVDDAADGGQTAADGVEEEDPPRIEIEVAVVDLTEEQKGGSATTSSSGIPTPTPSTTNQIPKA